jgi:hypothetical protein
MKSIIIPISILAILVAGLATYQYVKLSHRTAGNSIRVGEDKQFEEDTRQLFMLSDSVGKTISLEGKAWDEKAGAAIFVGSNPVYIDSLQAWPINIKGKTIVVSGTLAQTEYFRQSSSEETVGQEVVKNFTLKKAHWDLK